MKNLNFFFILKFSFRPFFFLFCFQIDPSGWAPNCPFKSTADGSASGRMADGTLVLGVASATGLVAETGDTDVGEVTGTLVEPDFLLPPPDGLDECFT